MIEKGLKIIGEFLKERFIAELYAQGHNASGQHIESIAFDVSGTSGGWEIVFTSLPYGKYLETGTEAGRYVPIKALMEWVEQKGIAMGDREVKNAAYAIRQAIYNEGTPTKGSYEHTSNGRRTDWISFVAEENKARINEKLAIIVGELINTDLSNLARTISAV